MHAVDRPVTLGRRWLVQEAESGLSVLGRVQVDPRGF